MEKAEMKIVSFGNEDVIATSGGPKPLQIVLANFGNYTFDTSPACHGDATISTIGGEVLYTNKPYAVGSAASAINNALGILDVMPNTDFYTKNSQGEPVSIRLDDLLTNENLGDNTTDGYYNGIYTWVSGANPEEVGYFTKSN